MANKRIKDLSTTATSLASDDFVAVDGSSQGTRKIQKANLVNDISSEIAGTYLDEANNLSDVASKDTSKLNLEVPDVGTAPNEVPMSGQLGTMAFQDSAGVSVEQLEAETLTVDSGGSTQPTQSVVTNAGAEGSALELRNSATSADTSTALTFTNSTIAGSNYGAAKIAAVRTNAANGNTDVVISTSSSGSLSEAVRIDSSQRLGIGTSSPGSYNATANNLVVGAAGTGDRGITIASKNDSEGSLYFADGTTGNEQYRGYAVYQHAQDRLILGTAGTNRWYIDSSGSLKAWSSGTIDVGPSGGIYFSNSTDAAGATSEILSDYEEGDWSPTFAPAVGSFAALTMDVIHARYIKIGSLVHLEAYIRTDNVDTTGASGNLIISGLPYATNNFAAVNVGYSENWTTVPLSGWIGSAGILLQKRATVNSNSTALSVSDMTTGSTADQNRVIFNVTYDT